MSAREAGPVTDSSARPWTSRRVFLMTLAVVGVIALAYLGYQLVNVLFMLFIAIVLATAMRPLVRWSKRWRIPDELSVLLIYAILLLVVIGMFAVLVPLLVEQGSTIVQNIPDYYEGLRSTFQESQSQLLRRLSRNLPAQLELGSLAGAVGPESEAGTDQFAIVGQGINVLLRASWMLMSVFVVFLIAYFWTIDRERIVGVGLLVVHPDRREKVENLIEDLEAKVGAYIRGQALLMLVIGVLSTVAFFAIGLESALLLGLIAGVLEAIPVLGPMVSALLAIILTLTEAPDKVWWVLGAAVLIQQIENAVLVPRIMGKAVGVNAIVTLLAITAFGSLFGVMGAIMAIPMAAIIQVMLDQWVLNRDTLPSGTSITRDRLAVVRYQTQELMSDLREQIRDMPPTSQSDEGLFEEQVEVAASKLDQMLSQPARSAS